MKALKNINEKNLLAFDVETARTEEVLRIDTPIFEAWAYKKRKKEPNITDLEVINSYQKEASLFAEFSRAVSVVLGMIKDEEIHTVVYDDIDERRLLQDLNNHFNRLLGDNPRLILTGFNVKGFDMPFLMKRMIINGIEPSPIIDVANEKPWNVTALDLMELWRGTSFGNSSLLSVATALGLPSPKDGIDGSMVSEAFWNGRIKEISAYCVRDTETVLNIYRKLVLKTPLKSPTKMKIIKTEKTPMLDRLFAGGKYTAADKKELTGKLNKMDDSGKKIAKVVISAMISNAKGKVTDINKKDFKELW